MLASAYCFHVSNRHFCSLQTHYGISYRDSLDVTLVCQQISHGSKKFGYVYSLETKVIVKKI